MGYRGSIVVEKGSYGGYVVVQKGSGSDKVLASFPSKQQAEEFKRKYRP